MGLHGDAIATEEWKRSYAEAYRRVQELLSAGSSVIFDDTNFLRSQRDQLRGIASSRQAETYVLYIPTPEADVRKRWQQNRAKARRGDVRDDDFALVVRQFEPPMPDERVIPCNPLSPITWLEGFIAEILAEVRAAK